MPVSYPYTQYGGIWKLNAASAAQGAGTWPVPPQDNLFMWGANGLGQLGLGNAVNYSSPKQVGTSTSWLEVSAQYHTLGVRKNGTLWAWGRGAQGQLGLGNTTNYSSPKQVGALTNWRSVSTGYYGSLAIKSDGTLWSWGGNNYGFIAQGAGASSTSSPVQVGLLTDWLRISSGAYQAMAVKTDGTLWSWGYNAYGQLGVGNTTTYSSPKQVGALTSWLNIAAAQYVSFATKTDGTLWAWGLGANGAIGNGTVNNYSSPIQVGALTNWLKVSSAYGMGVSVKTNGTVWSWGRNNVGQLGLGDTTNRSSPNQIGALTNWSDILANNSDVCVALKTDGTLWSWGRGAYGTTGLGNTTDYSSPKQIGSQTYWTALTKSFRGISVGAIALTT